MYDGYITWINPFNRAKQYVSLKKTKLIVFWTKNPQPFFKYLPQLDSMGYNYYFHFTLNDYEKERLEPGLPPLSDRINSFKYLSDKIGKKKVIWRFDPLVVGQGLSVEQLIEKIFLIADKINTFTTRMIFSFIDINNYQKVKKRIDTRYPNIFREFTKDEQLMFAEQLQAINKQFKLLLFSCGEDTDLSSFGIKHSSCIDGKLIAELFGGNVEIMRYLARCGKKDMGQRKNCLCIPSKDIGMYNSCQYNCLYCYAKR